MKTSQCKLELVVCCTSQVADIGCKHYQESKHTPLKCAHRDDTECLNKDARQEAVNQLLAGAVNAIITRM